MNKFQRKKENLVRKLGNTRWKIEEKLKHINKHKTVYLCGAIGSQLPSLSTCMLATEVFGDFDLKKALIYHGANMGARALPVIGAKIFDSIKERKSHKDWGMENSWYKDEAFQKLKYFLLPEIVGGNLGFYSAYIPQKVCNFLDGK